MLKQVICSTRKLFFLIALSSTLIACGGSEFNAIHSLLGDHNLSLDLTGTVGDGPVINANIVIKDPTGTIVAMTVSDETAHYTAHIPEGTVYPLTLSVYGGIDTVTNAAPTFEMTSVVENVYQATANINSFTTLITKSAEAMGSGLNFSSINLAKLQITNSMSFGLNSHLLPDAIASEITETNVASYIKASVTMGEWIRRTHETLLTEESHWSQDDLVSVLAADLVDGILDGQGAVGTDEAVAAIANVLAAQVLIEMLSQTLKVSNVDVMNSF